MTPPQIGLGVDDHHRQPRILSLQLLHQHVGVVGQLEERDEERVRADEIADGGAGVVDRSELRDLHAVLAERAPRRDADQRVALEEDDVAIRGVGRLDFDQSAGDFELAAMCGRLARSRAALGCGAGVRRSGSGNGSSSGTGVNVCSSRSSGVGNGRMLSSRNERQLRRLVGWPRPRSSVAGGGSVAAAQRSSALPDLQRLLEAAQRLELLAVRGADDLLRREAAFLENRVGVVLDVERPDVIAEDEVELPFAALQQRRDDADDALVNGRRRDRPP